MILFFCRYETVQRTGTSVYGDAASEYYLLPGGGKNIWFAAVYKERYHNEKQKYQHIYF